MHCHDATKELLRASYHVSTMELFFVFYCSVFSTHWWSMVGGPKIVVSLMDWWVTQMGGSHRCWNWVTDRIGLFYLLSKCVVVWLVSYQSVSDIFRIHGLIPLSNPTKHKTGDDFFWVWLPANPCQPGSFSAICRQSRLQTRQGSADQAGPVQ